MFTAARETSLYLDLLKKTLLDLIYTDPNDRVILPQTGDRLTVAEARAAGLDWPARALTMIGMARLNNLQYCVEKVLQSRVPGDLIETGVWRGGACIFMRAILKAYDVTDRTVWVADSFCGLPAPDAKQYPYDSNLDLSGVRELAVSRQEVERNFERFGLLDGQVQFLEGFFKDTLRHAPMRQIAVLRLDGDLYESTMDALTALYPKVSPGGFVIVDDFGSIPATQQAVVDYRAAHGITEDIHFIDTMGAFWQQR